MEEPATASLSVGVVVYHSDLTLLSRTLASLAESVAAARREGGLNGVGVTVVDNGSPDPEALDRAVASALPPERGIAVAIRRGHGNVGYGRGHNIAIEASAMTYHLILNPDAVLEPAALRESIRFFGANADVGLLAPDVHGSAGERQFLCRRYPSVLVLLLRGFAPRWLRWPFATLLDRYELRDRMDADVVRDVPIASGCFMFARREVLAAVGGFSPDYFLYFEDYDLSMRIRRRSRIAYVSRVRIVHHGGDAARKGGTHVRLFLNSALRFFRTHGWKIA
ncbi:glycosyltransferase family 2 protein [soil metagenome]